MKKYRRKPVCALILQRVIKFKVSTLLLLVPLFSVGMTEALSQTSMKSRQGRLFSLAITPPKISNANNFWSAYEGAIDLGIEVGMDLPGELHFIWSNTEKSSVSGSISYEDKGSEWLVQVLKRKKLPVVITISPFETVNSRIPGDLVELPYNHPEVLARFKEFINWVYKVTNELDAVAIVLGNEFDVHFSFEGAKGRNRWPEFESMVVETKNHVKSLERWRVVPFAIEPTYAGLVGSSWQELQRINRHADIIGVSYYPLKENTVHEPVILHEHLRDLFRVYPEKKIDFYQYGYPSSEKLNSSLEKQRQFVENTFKYWDIYANRIRLITFTWLYDVQQTQVDKMSGDALGELSPTEAFTEFIGSLGLHGRETGTEKPAFRELKRQLDSRNWSKE